jgi:DNA-binding LacI/PurR family transcriptional regulator
MKKPVTLIDVAREAGVAIGTVSRVLNNAANVNPESRQNVLETITRLNYHRLRKRRGADRVRERDPERPRNIGLVLLGMDDTLVHVPVLSEVFHGVEAGVTRINGNLLFANLPNADRVPPFFKGDQIEGLIVKTSQYSQLPAPETNTLVKRILRLPMVWVWARPEHAPGDVCTFNHESAARLVAEHLAAKGHRRVAFLNPKKGKSSLEHIKKEFQFAGGKLGLDITSIESAPGQEATWPEQALSGTQDVLPLVKQWHALPAASRPTALFVPADNFTIHVNAALERLGVRVGQDVSLISCNNERSLTASMTCRLTTVDVHAQRIGAKCVEQLLWRIKNPGDNIQQTILLEPCWVEGDSVVQL